jgi:hypothetical protein
MYLDRAAADLLALQVVLGWTLSNGALVAAIVTATSQTATNGYMVSSILLRLLNLFHSLLTRCARDAVGFPALLGRWPGRGPVRGLLHL